MTYRPGAVAGRALRSGVQEFTRDPAAFRAALRRELRTHPERGSTPAGSHLGQKASDVTVAAERSSGVLWTPKVASPKLQNIITDLYKGTTNPNRIGTGTTADAIRSEFASGEATAGKMHFTKGQEYSRALENWLRKNPHSPDGDRLVAQSLLNDLRAALQGSS